MFEIFQIEYSKKKCGCLSAFWIYIFRVIHSPRNADRFLTKLDRETHTKNIHEQFTSNRHQSGKCDAEKIPPSPLRNYRFQFLCFIINEVGMLGFVSIYQHLSIRCFNSFPLQAFDGRFFFLPTLVIFPQWLKFHTLTYNDSRPFWTHFVVSRLPYIHTPTASTLKFLKCLENPWHAFTFSG